MTSKNPFAIRNLPNGQILEGNIQEGSTGIDAIEATDLWTYVAVCDGPANHGNSTVLTRIAGVWNPAVGATVQLCEPNRDATVCSVWYQFDINGKLVTIVYLDDSATTLT